ncbi:hypothetical protein ABZ478_25590, partial [Streptomyces sp. NPDC005706]
TVVPARLRPVLAVYALRGLIVWPLPLLVAAVAAGEIVGAAGRYARGGPDLTELGAADIAWWRLVVEGSGNIAYLLAFNSLVEGTLPVADVPGDLRTAELLDVAARLRLASYIEAREPEAAERLARELLSRSVPTTPRTAVR